MDNLNKLEKILAGQPKYRLKQIYQHVFCDLITSWDQATNLPKELREKLAGEFSLEINGEIYEAKDGQSAKAVITLEDGMKIETVLMRHERQAKSKSVARVAPLPRDCRASLREARNDDSIDEEARNRNTVCVSSQVGCPLGCVFCATGKNGFKRNLSEWEIVEQVLFWQRWLKLSCHFEAEDRRLSRECETDIKSEIPRFARNDKQSKDELEHVNNVVFMGMGEPFLNYDNVIAAIRIINDQKGLNIGARHISVSTAGIVDGIEKFSGEKLQVNLALSLHAPNDELRSKIMPINNKYPLEKLLKAVDDYILKTRRKVMFEYIMIKGVNDSDECARELAGLLSQRELVFVNLIRYNPTGIFDASSEKRVKEFKDILMKSGVQAIERYRFGGDIKGACGQLAGQ